MPHTGGYRYIVQARCSLIAWLKWHMLRVETRCTIGAFIFKEILCRWGMVGEIVTDNGTAYIAALDWLIDRYHQQKSTFLIPSYSILLHLIPLILGVRRE